MIDSAFQEQLMAALKDAVGHFNNGMDPTDAVVKTAQDCGFNIDQAQRLAEIFNTAKSIHHFHKHANQDTKAQKFELVDSDAVVVRLFNKPAIKSAENIIGYTYEAPPSDRFATPDFVLPPVRKAAKFTDTNIDTQTCRANKQYRSYVMAVKQAEENSESCRIKAGMLLNELAAMMKRGGVDECKDRFARLYVSVGQGEYKDTWNKFADLIPSYARFDAKYLSKYGELVDARDLSTLADILKRAHSLFMSADDICRRTSAIKSAAEEFKGEFDGLVRRYVGAVEEPDISDFFVHKEGASDDQGDDQKPKKYRSKQGAGGQGAKKDRGGNTILGTIAGGVGNSIGDEAKRTANELLIGNILTDNKRISERMRNLHRTAILQDLIVNDPVIGEVDPKITAQAYTTIMQTAPEVSTNKEVVRSILRQSVHSLAVSPFDAGSWASLEKTTKEIAGTLPPVKQIRTDLNKR